MRTGSLSYIAFGLHRQYNHMGSKKKKRRTGRSGDKLILKAIRAYNGASGVSFNGQAVSVSSNSKGNHVQMALNNPILRRQLSVVNRNHGEVGPDLRLHKCCLKQESSQMAHFGGAIKPPHSTHLGPLT
jgi:hypothetical protein